MINSLLAIKWDVSPYIFSIGGFQLRWYGVLFVSGFIFGYWLFSKYYKREGLPSKLLDPMLYMLLICALVGARLGHVFFYEWDYYKEHLGEILKVWHGGLASHGGAFAILIGIWILKSTDTRPVFLGDSFSSATGRAFRIIRHSSTRLCHIFL